jgi:adenosylcobyric acid synthase
LAAIMIQGCGSDVGKSVLTAGLCRLFANRRLRVRPFKPQNMSNNAAVTADGGEIGRAQAVQALACRVAPTVHMNPILLKPQSDRDAQLVVRGRMAGTCSAGAYQLQKRDLLPLVIDSFRLLEAESDLVVVEGAGSPAEINLRSDDVANMGFAIATQTPVVLAGDIDRGHVIAALVGAHAVLADPDRALIKGFVINKFRGDLTLLDEGRAEIVRRTGWMDLGVIPWLPAARMLPAEDAVVQLPRRTEASVRIVIPLLSRIANFDEFDALRAESEADVRFVPPGQALPGDADLVILPGTKATIADLAFFRAQGWDIDLAGHVRRGGHVLGICGGFQMLGNRIEDPGGVEGPPGSVEGLRLLDIDTVLTGEKVLKPGRGRLAEDEATFEGYEMHVGRSQGPAMARPFLILHPGIPDGAVSANGRIAGGYVHGLFNLPGPRAALLGLFGRGSNAVDQNAVVDTALDDVAAALEQALKIDAILRIAKSPV